MSSQLVCPNPALKNTALCTAPCWQWLFLGSTEAMLPSALALFLSDNTGCCLPGIYPSCCVWKLGQRRLAFWHTLYSHHSSLWAARSHNSVAWGETWMHWTTARAAEKELLFIADYMFWPNSDRKAYLSQLHGRLIRLIKSLSMSTIIRTVSCLNDDRRKARFKEKNWRLEVLTI